MPRNTTKSVLNQLDTLTTTPPAELPGNHTIARIASAQGKNLFQCALPSGKTILCELAPMFRGKTWLIRGGFVVVDMESMKGRENKIEGEIVNVVREERGWKKMSWWPEEFKKDMVDSDDEEDEEDTRGMMPPSDSEDEDERR